MERTGIIKVKGKNTEPIGVKEIIKGRRLQGTNPLTGEVITQGDYTVLYDVSDDRHCNHFLLRFIKV